MRKLILLIWIAIPLFSYSEDYLWWNIKHGWEPGKPGWRNFMHITPGYLGPNALSVPDVKKGVVQEGTNLEFGLDFHFRNGDPTQDISAKYYRSFADGKIAVELYGVIAEHYSMSDFVRDERISRDFDGKGFANGDLFFSTLIQLVKGRKFPDTMVRMAGRTASGNQLEGARYSDSPGYFFDFSFSKSYAGRNEKISLLPFASFGFYSWQTNDELNLQNDAFMYGLGTDLKGLHWTISNSLSGYSGYKNERDKPMVYTFDLKHHLANKTVRLQYLHGLRDWTYRTVKLSLILNLQK
ncbi:MAG: hypothetical protein Q8S54_12675 [Bacteroidota bacterium]|nr:hypothetical protein [Odoribacter sp.]MDP3644032.1 hypothetical protein [Bacteroidota bacterium]